VEAVGSGAGERVPARVAFLIGNLRYFSIRAQSKDFFTECDDEKATPPDPTIDVARF
jgi:hypothetical protein